MSAIDWSKHTPHEIRMAVDSPPKVAGPWRRTAQGGHGRCERGKLVGHVAKFGFWHVYEADSEDAFAHGRHSSVEDGKAQADAALRSAGWLLDDEDERPGSSP